MNKISYKKIVLADKYPVLVEQWNYDKNGDMSPYNVPCRSNRKAWWKCKKCNYEWESVINNRTRNNNCPSCSGRAITPSNCLAKKCPELAAEWHPTKNGELSPYNIALRSGKKVWWKCNECDYEWQCSPIGRTARNRITKCSNCNSLALKNPELSKEWHPMKNEGMTPFDVDYGSFKKVWWKCNKCGKDWKAEIRSRNIGEKACPLCNCLVKQNPSLAAEWHPTKNGELTPFKVSKYRHGKVWWKCIKCGFEWQAEIQARTRGVARCSSCNSLGVKNPELSKEWHPTKNLPLTPFDVSWGSNVCVWWKCSSCSFEWKSRIMSRVDGVGCPACCGIRLKDGTVCSSLTDAYFYLLFMRKGLKFMYNKKYSSGKEFGMHRYDFYFPNENKYVEVTGYNNSFKHWAQYLRRIVLKKRYVESIGGKFEFIIKTLNSDERKEVIPYIKRNG